MSDDWGGMTIQEKELRRENARLRAEVESLQDQIEARNAREMEKGIYVTVEQIDAAWEMLEKYSKHAHWLEMLLRECFGICRCPECGGTGDVFLKPSEFYTTGGEESKKCPNCHGHGWVREERDDE